GRAEAENHTGGFGIMTWTLEDFWNELSVWSQATFGLDQLRGPTFSLKHLAKEVQECLAAPHDLEEYADLQFLVFDAARRAGFSYAQLVEAVRHKLAVNRSRQWPKPT